MRKSLVIIVSAGIIASACFRQHHKKDSRQDYEAFLRSHPYHLELSKGEGEEEEGEEETDRPDLAFMQDYLRTMDPRLKRPRPEILYKDNVRTARLRDKKSSSQEARVKGTTLADNMKWEERGPKTIGGRTRAMMFDPSDPSAKKVWAGGVSGGLWYNDNIASATSGWIKVDDLWDNLAITCITSDPVNPEIFYVGTGEGWLNADLVLGAGIWKTTDGGITWNQLASTTAYAIVNDIVVRNENGNGVVYAAVQSGFFNGFSATSNGLYRSADAGVSWTQVLPASISQKTPTDIEIGKDNKLFVGARPKFSGGEATIYQSTDATGSLWSSQDFEFEGRVEIACAPSDALTAYVVFANADNEVGAIEKTLDGGDNWTPVNVPADADLGIPADDFSRGQAWYDLALAVHPADPNTVIIGAIDLFATTDGGTSWSQLSKWSNNANLNTLSCAIVHADQHNILFRPGFPNEIIVGNDGGIYYAADISSAAATNAFSARNLDYNVTQFYTAAIHPTLTNYMLAGAQDNGTQKFTEEGFGATTEAYGGDGAMCFIDQVNPDFQIVSYTYNNVYLSTDGGLSFNTQLLEDNASGNFINNGEYDSNLKILFTAKDDNSIYRVKDVTDTPSSESVSVPGLGSIVTAMRLSPFIASQSNLYVGTQAGRIFKIINAQDAAPSITEITGPLFPNGSVSGIAFGADENQVLVTFFNYGVTSVWETTDGGGTWVNKEGDLPDMPVRWAEYHPQNPAQVFLATELGVWSTEDITQTSPHWSSTNGGLANVRTDKLQIRKSDGIMMAATHGRGVFTAIVPSHMEQTISFDALSEKTFGDEPFDLTASATSGLPVTFSSSDPDIASVAGATVTINAAGEVTITADQDGNDYYEAADPVLRTLTVNKRTQVITFAEIPEKTINDEPFSLAATSSSSLPVTYTSADPGVATVVGNVVNITGTGETTITASQAGDNNYLAAADVARQLTVVSRIIKLTGNLDFGEVAVGKTASLEFKIENTGTAAMTIDNIIYPEGYTGTTQITDNAIRVTVTFAPTIVGEYAGEIEVESNATSGDNTIDVTGTGIEVTGVGENAGSPVRLYPNPAEDWITISGAEFKGIESLEVSDRNGRTFIRYVESSGRELRMKVDDLASGVYMVNIPVGNACYTIKFTKN